MMNYSFVSDWLSTKYVNLYCATNIYSRILMSSNLESILHPQLAKAATKSATAVVKETTEKLSLLDRASGVMETIGETKLSDIAKPVTTITEGGWSWGKIFIWLFILGLVGLVGLYYLAKYYFKDLFNLITAMKPTPKPTKPLTPHEKEQKQKASAVGEVEAKTKADAASATDTKPVPANNELPDANKTEPQPDEAGSATQSTRAKSKAGYCYIGEDRGFRSCIAVGENDTCMSGDIFPTMDRCINPNLR